MIINDAEAIREHLANKCFPEVSGRRGLRIAVPCVETAALVRYDLIQANAYNPNAVSPDKMALLKESIMDNGFCFPIVTGFDEDLEKLIIIDGFHRYTIGGPAWLSLSHVPVVILKHDAAQRMSATWQFNKARGVHSVDLDAELIRMLIEQGIDEDEICTKLGVDLDTVHRYKQVTGIAALFGNATYSMSWEMEEVDG